MLRKRVGVLVSGGGTNLQALLDYPQNAYEIVCVISSRPDAFALKRADNRGIDAACLKTGAEILAFLRSHDVDFVILAGYLRLLDTELLRTYENKIINIHPSLIPSFCGRGFYGINVHNAAMARGVKITGATVHFVNEEYDAGPIIAQKAVAVRDEDTPETLRRRVMEEAEWDILPKAAEMLALGRLKIEGGRVIILN